MPYQRTGILFIDTSPKQSIPIRKRLPLAIESSDLTELKFIGLKRILKG
jgi:hypothetical protein